MSCVVELPDDTGAQVMWLVSCSPHHLHHLPCCYCSDVLRKLPAVCVPVALLLHCCQHVPASELSTFCVVLPSILFFLCLMTIINFWLNKTFGLFGYFFMFVAFIMFGCFTIALHTYGENALPISSSASASSCSHLHACEHDSHYGH